MFKTYLTISNSNFCFTELPKMARCISVQKLFGHDIESIESQFENGVADDRALIKWKIMKAEILLHKGMPQGVYRLERDGIWTVGNIRNGRVHGSCWVVLPTHVSFTLTKQ